MSALLGPVAAGSDRGTGYASRFFARPDSDYRMVYNAKGMLYMRMRVPKKDGR